MKELVSIKTRGLLFDMDGVLISSIGSVERGWSEWAERYGVDREYALSILHGRRAIDTVRVLRPDIDAAAGLKVIEDIEMADVGDIIVLPGVIELLKRLPADRWTIVTSATMRLAKRRLEAAGIPLPAQIITAEMVAVGKPDPEPYRRGAELLGFDVSECVVVEDAPSGVGAGKAAGSAVLGVLGTHTAAELHGADWRVHSLESMTVAVEGDWMRVGFEAI